MHGGIQKYQSPTIRMPILKALRYQSVFSSKSMETCSIAMLTQIKQCPVTKFLTVENVTPIEIDRHLKAVYGDN